MVKICPAAVSGGAGGGGSQQVSCFVSRAPRSHGSFEQEKDRRGLFSGGAALHQVGNGREGQEGEVRRRGGGRTGSPPFPWGDWTSRDWTRLTGR